MFWREKPHHRPTMSEIKKLIQLGYGCGVVPDILYIDFHFEVCYNELKKAIAFGGLICFQRQSPYGVSI